ncbi:MAG: hypothetical protein J7J57_00505 [Caldisericaceae bacterium]|nr:hypothetical protein [Caldisericaceae bacterium]
MKKKIKSSSQVRIVKPLSHVRFISNASLYFNILAILSDSLVTLFSILDVTS